MAASEGQPAFLMDGLSLERQPVRLFPMKAGLVLVRADGGEERLPFEQLLLVSDLPDRTILGRRDAPDWRLSVAPPLSERRLERLRRQRRQPGRTALVYAAVAVLLGGFGALAWFRGGEALEAAAPHVPASVTVPLGEAIANDVAGGRFCRTPASDAALDRLLARLLPEGGRAEPVVVRVADLPVANALAAPGGQVLLTRGLIEKAGGPDEVAGVLAHELGHVEHRHATQMLLRNLGMSILVSGTGSDLAAVGDTLLMTAMSRDREREADLFAIGALARAGISPAGLIAFFEREMPKAGTAGKDGQPAQAATLLDRIGTWASTHPPTPERLAVYRAAAARAGETTPAMDEADWAALKAAMKTGCRPTLPDGDRAS